jgi:uncharacterized protein (DUF58 family)
MAALGLFVLALAGLIFAFVDDWPAITFISVAAMVVIAISFLWSWTSLVGLSFARRVSSDRVQVGDQLREELVIRNRSLFGKLFLEIEDRSTLPGHVANRVIKIGPRSVRQWRVGSIARQRGRHRLGPVTLRSGDPFGLFRRQRRIPGTLDLTIYPLTVELDPYVPGSVLQSGGSTIQRRSMNPTTTVGGIREYVAGDAINRVSWTATARAGKLMVKEFESDPTADVWVVLDLISDEPGPAALAQAVVAPDDPLSWLGNDFEYRVMMAASLGRRALGLGRSVGLMINTPEPVVLPPERTDRQYVRILELLAVVESRHEAPVSELLTQMSPRFRRDNVVLIVTSRIDFELVGIAATMRLRRVLPEVVFVDPEPVPSDEALRFLADFQRERISSYRLTRDGHPAVALHQPTGIPANGVR